MCARSIIFCWRPQSRPICNNANCSFGVPEANKRVEKLKIVVRQTKGPLARQHLFGDTVLILHVILLLDVANFNCVAQGGWRIDRALPAKVSHPHPQSFATNLHRFVTRQNKPKPVLPWHQCSVPIARHRHVDQRLMAVLFHGLPHTY